MARITVYVPDHLAEAAKEAGLDISRLTQDAIGSTLDARQLDSWQQRVAELPSTRVGHRAVIDAVSAAKEELEGG